MQHHPCVVFCTTCKGRAQHIERTLPRNLSDIASYRHAKIVLLDYGSPDGLVQYVKNRHQKDLDSGRLIFYSFPGAGKFRMSHAKNMAHRLGIMEGANILVNMDADNYSAPGFAEYIAEHLDNCENKFLWANAKSVLGRARQGLAGRIALWKSAFLKAGGYDERYIVWAPEDEDFKARLRRLRMESENIEDRFLHVIPHKDGLRFREYPEAKPTPESEAAALKEIKEACHVIANYGKFGEGTVYRNFDFERPIVLGRVPTRVFGIGMQKTATNSLDKAFKILGLDGAHWLGPWWAKEVWEQVTATGQSFRVDRHYSFSDLPFSLLYQKLDHAYPGSKFILTWRHGDRWLESLRKHWEVNSAKFAWDQDCFTHRIHRLTYGRKSFDAATMLNRYRLHNAEVREYFKHRPADLLDMDMDGGAGWKELCPFLQEPIPNIPYPQEFRSLIS